MSAEAKNANPTTGIFSQRGVERITAVALLLYILSLAVMIISRVSSQVDQATALESVRMISVNCGWYLGLATAALTSGVLLVVVAVFGYRVSRNWDPTLALLSSSLFFSASWAVCVGAIGGLILAQEYGASLPQPELALKESYVQIYNAIDPLRATAGRLGFTFAALAMLTWSGLIAVARPAPRWFGWLGIPIGAAMFFIWDPEATAMHRIGGIAYMLWLALLAGWLFFRGLTPRATP